jgi:hypothetical protein
MEQDRIPVTLYDFLYRDSSRITSYYAQLFGGHLTALERTESEKDTQPKQTRLDAGFITHEEGIIRENLTGDKRVINPHDLITTDTLSHLQSNGLLQTDASTASHGSLIVSQGTLVLTDSSMLGLASVFYDAAIREEQNKPRNQQDKAAIQNFTLLKEMLNKIDLPSAFLLKTIDGQQIVGIIKEDGMEEPILSYYFKHGAAGLSDVYVIGIKEVAATNYTLAATDFLSGIQQMAQAASELLFPPDAIRVTPLALFRKVETPQKSLPLA